jgi:hypothetical protein
MIQTTVRPDVRFRGGSAGNGDDARTAWSFRFTGSLYRFQRTGRGSSGFGSSSGSALDMFALAKTGVTLSSAPFKQQFAIPSR